MAARYSTAFITSLLLTASAKSTMEGASGFVIDIYSGSQPATADTAPTGTLLATVSNNSAGTGIHFGSALDASLNLNKAAGETWSGNGITGGVAGWFRVRLVGDNSQTTNTTSIRLDGAISTAGGELNTPTVTVTQGMPFYVTGFSLFTQ